MNLRDFHYLVALDRLRHFGRAAEACHVSQPTLSTQIKKLEEELGVPLIERVPRQILFTAAGRDILERAKRVLAEVEQMRETARRNKDAEAGSVRLGMFPSLGPYFLPHIVSKIRARFPQLELLLVEEKTDVLLAMLRSGQLDAAALALPVQEEGLHTEFLFSEPFLLALPNSHPLAKQPNFTLTDLSQQHLLLLEEGHCLREQALEVCHLAGASEKEGFRATSLETLRHMVAAGVGITLLPMLTVKPPVPPSDNMTLRAFKKPGPTRSIALVWRKSSAMAAFLGELATVMRDLPTELLEKLPMGYGPTTRGENLLRRKRTKKK